MGNRGSIPTDDNGKPVLAMLDDATGLVVPIHIKSKVTGSDGNTYAIMDINATIANATALGQATKSASLPVAIASDQDALATKVNGTLIYSTTQTGLSATFDSSDLPVGQFLQLLLVYNLSAFTGTNVTFKIRTRDVFSNPSSIANTSALTTTALSTLGVNSATPFGNTVFVEATAVSVSSMTFQLSLYGK